MSAPLTPEELREAVEHASRVIEWLADEDCPYFGETGDLERDARGCAQVVLSFAAALLAVEQERDEQDVQLAEAITAKIDAEREVVRLKAQLAALKPVREWNGEAYETHSDLYAETLAHHALVEVRCDHDRQMDMAVCNCAVVSLGWHPSVQEAKLVWARHVLAVLASVSGADAPHPCPAGDECALNKGAIHCFHCRRNWPRDETWEIPLEQRPVLQRASGADATEEQE